MIDQFDRLRKRNAFMEQYKKEKMFENGLEEFDDARSALTFLDADDQVSKECDFIGRQRRSSSRSTRHAKAPTTSPMYVPAHFDSSPLTVRQGSPGEADQAS